MKIHGNWIHLKNGQMIGLDTIGYGIVFAFMLIVLLAACEPPGYTRGAAAMCGCMAAICEEE